MPRVAWSQSSSDPVVHQSPPCSESIGHCRHDRQCKCWCLMDQEEEAVSVDDGQHTVDRGDRGCHTRGGVDESHFAKHVVNPKERDHPVLGLELNLAFDDAKQLITRFTFLKDDTAGRDVQGALCVAKQTGDLMGRRILWRRRYVLWMQFGWIPLPV